MLKLINLNTWSYRLTPALNSFLAAQKADILCLQEVTSAPYGYSTFFDGLQHVEKTLAPEHVFYSPAYAMEFSGRDVYLGLAIISCLPLTAMPLLRTHGDYIPDYDRTIHDYNVRFLQHAVVGTTDGKKIHVLNYHGYHVKGSKTGNDVTTAHCQMIADYLATLKGPVILAGDFNLAPNSASLKPIDAKLHNLCAKHHVTTTRTPFAHSPDVVDYLWVSGDVTVANFKVLPDLVSDHAALMLEFSI